ncbi:dihydrolipoyl dehydrogenase family protein [Radiobacillus sp. PE A8.2]|uniref:dihydrolipoyl dehydrogenase family protein n=1 Tax=Radiobacillus sp. PE A8.2 TaxID=3380349 RepID=UPI0038911296
MDKNYDLIVIGSGSAGSTTATKAVKEGLKVAMIDERPFGGTCALRGCDPKKVLIGVSEYASGVERLKANGLNGDISIDWQDLMAFKKKFTDAVPESIEKSLNDSGIDTYHGHATFVDHHTIQVDDSKLSGDKILIATGASPTPLSIEGNQHFTYSDDFLELEQLPDNILFVGGGYISFEFAHLAARAGANVQILHRSKRPLKNFDEELVNYLTDYSKNLGITIHLETEVQAIKKTDNGYVAVGKQADQQEEFEADMVVHGAGRTPNIADLGLENANIITDKYGVSVNEYLQSTSNPAIYAAGDVSSTGRKPLTPVAGAESHIAASNILKGNNRSLKDQVIPTAMFTLPKLTSVGVTEEEATKKGLSYTVNSIDTTEWFTYSRTNQPVSFAKVLIHKKTDQIIGAHLLSNQADELINHFATAIQFNLTTSDLKKMLFAYPTTASDIVHFL